MSAPRLALRTETLQACPACGAPRFHTVLEGADFDFGTGGYRIEQCDGCQLRFTNPRPIPEDVPLLYADRTFETLPTGDSALGRLREARLKHRLRALARRFPEAARLRCCDVGTGDGFFALIGAGMPWCAHMTAVDFFPEPPAGLQAALASGALDYLGLEAFFADAAVYDVVFLRFVLEHVRDPREFLAAFGRKLAPHATLVIEVPNWKSLWRKLFGKYYSELSLPAHTFHYDPAVLRSLLVGFECEVLENVHGVVLAKSLGNAVGSPVARTGPLAMAALGLELLADTLIGPPANMTVIARKLS